MKHSRTRLLAAAATTACVLGVVGAATAAFADDSPTDLMPTTITAARDFAPLRAAGTPAALADRSLIAGLLAGERGPVGDVGPLRHELRPSSEGRVVLDDTAGRRIATVPSSRGDVCIRSTRGDQEVMTSCVQEFPETGITAAFITASTATDLDEVFGLVGPGVKSIQVHTADGATHEVEVADGGYWWSATDPEMRIASVSTERRGRTFSEEAPPLYSAARG